MCGRYAFFTDKELREIHDITEKVSNDIQHEKMKTGEIFPTDLVPVILEDNNLITPKLFTWGFPNFKNKGVIINARAETAHEKYMFKASLEAKRCIIPSTGFYECDKNKNKYIFNLPDSQVLYMAGLYNNFDGENRFVILTTNANASISEVHDRMPVVLPKTKLQDWLFSKHAARVILNETPPELIRQAE